MAAPGIFDRIAYETGPHRIAADVTHQRQKAGIRCDQLRAVAPLEQVARRRDTALLAARVTRGNGLHEASQRGPPHLHGQVNMVRHPAGGFSDKTVQIGAGVTVSVARTATETVTPAPPLPKLTEVKAQPTPSA
jgi:hypothetical protein